MAALALVAAACGGQGRAPTAPTSPTPSTTPTTPTTLSPASSQACVEPGSGGAASIPWDTLRNPIYSLPEAAVKDVAVRMAEGKWQLLFSHVREDPFRFRIGLATSPDFVDWSPVELWDQPEVGGVASPDVTREPDGTYAVTYNSHTRDTDGKTKMYVRTSADFRSWSAPRRLAFEVRPRPDDQLIDAAVAHAGHGLVLGYNHQENLFEVAWSASGSLDGPWRLVGVADTGPLENYQFLLIDGTWHMLGTTVPVHHELLYRLAGPPEQPESWLHWTLVRELTVPSEGWNHPPGEVANAGYLCDARPLDGHWYLFYAGSTELDRFGGRGYAKMGVARSTDLVHWEVPPGTLRR